jgi:hypothetical protein
MSRLVPILMVAAVITLGCSLVGPAEGPHWEKKVAYVSAVSAPDTILAGRSFVVEICTRGGMDESYQGEDVLEVIAGGFRITPYDWHYVNAPVSNRGLVTYDHQILLTAGSPGVMILEILHTVFTTGEGERIATMKDTILVMGGS